MSDIVTLEKVNEVRDNLVLLLTDNTPALRFNEGKLDWTLVDYKSLEPFVKVLMEGAKKYAPDNWKKGMKLRDIRKSLGRHVMPLLNGDDIDPEFGLPHAGHAICNLMFYLYYTQTEEGKAKVIEE